MDIILIIMHLNKVQGSGEMGKYNLDRTEQYDLLNENWKQIEGYEGVYQVSDQGRVKKKYKNGKVYYSIGGKAEQGYLQVHLRLNGKLVARKRVHDLVAETFIRPIDYKKQCVHHISGIKNQNALSNLEIVDIASHHSQHNKGKKNSQEARTKMSLSHLGKKLSKEHCKRISQGKRKNRGEY